jgi:hypothetical protein
MRYFGIGTEVFRQRRAPHSITSFACEQRARDFKAGFLSYSLERRTLKLGCLVAEPINGLFLCHSVNFGFPALECRGIEAAFEEGDVADVSFAEYTVRNQRTGAALKAEPLSEAMKRLMEAGGLFPLLESEGYLAPNDAPVKGT